MEEFEEEVKDFSPEKENIKDKVDDLFGKGAGTVRVLHFIIEHMHCRLGEALGWQNHAPITIKDMMKK
jgi:hypothetical protein